MLGPCGSAERSAVAGVLGEVSPQFLFPPHTANNPIPLWGVPKNTESTSEDEAVVHFQACSLCFGSNVQRCQSFLSSKIASPSPNY